MIAPRSQGPTGSSRASRRAFLAKSAALAAAAAAPALVRSAETEKGKYRAAVIGCTGRGDYGHGLDQVWLDVPEAQLVAVADADAKGLAAAAERLKGPKQYADYRKMLDEVKPDLLSIAPRWVDQHCDMVVAAAQAGVKGIYLEKPLCRSLAEADAMIAACDKSKTKVAIAFQTRYSPKLQVIAELIASGKLGKVIEFRARGKEDARGGAEDLWVLGPHLMDLMLHFGGAAQSCFATVLQQGKPIAKADVKPGPEGMALIAGDEVHAMYRMAGGATAYFDSIKAAGGGPRFGVWIFGTKGVIELGTNYLPPAFFLPHTSWSQPRAKKEWLPIGMEGLGKPDAPLKDAPHRGNVLAVEDLIAAVEKDRPAVANLHEARAGLEMIFAALESQRQGRPVALPLENRQDPLGML